MAEVERPRSTQQVVNTQDNDGLTALYVAAHSGHVEAIRALLKAGADADHANHNGFTALYGAAQNGHVEAIQVLVEAWVEVNHANSDGWTALFFAAESGTRAKSSNPTPFFPGRTLR